MKLTEKQKKQREEVIRQLNKYWNEDNSIIKTLKTRRVK